MTMVVAAVPAVKDGKRNHVIPLNAQLQPRVAETEPKINV